MVFIGRKKELDYLDKKYLSKKAEFIIVYGRRRLGKTSLLKKSVSKNKKSNYFLFTEEPISKNLDSFKEQISLKLNKKIIMNLNSTSFVNLFSDIIDFIPKNYILIFDEFPYLIKQDNSIMSQFQKIYDEYLKEKDIKLILCGSSNSIMGDLMGYQSPLYGRRTGVIKLEEFTLYETKQFLSKINNLEDIFKYQMIYGGIPYYLEQINVNLTFEENFEELFFKRQSIFFDEVTFLLKEEFREVRNYLAILKSISKGKNKFSHIADDTNIEKSSLAKYFNNLEVLGIIKIIKSFFDKQNSKKTIYKINDNFIYFWFAIISNNISTIESINTQKNIHINLQREFGFLFEQICMTTLKKNYEKIGTYFREVEIDILGQNGKTIDCFECKFKSNINSNQILKNLNTKIKYLPKEFNYKTKLISKNVGITLKDLILMSK